MTNSISTDEASRHLTRTPGAALFLIIVSIAFGQALLNQYAYDSVMLLEHARSADGTPHSLRFLIDSRQYAPLSAIMSYRPVTMLLLHVLDIRLFRESSLPSHALNLLIHALNAWLLYRIAWTFTSNAASTTARLASSLAGATLFAVHPLISETVLCMGFRFDLLGLFFVLLAINIALTIPSRARISHSSFLWRAALILLFLPIGFFSKETGYAALILVPLAAWFRTKRRAPALTLFLLLLLALTVCIAIWRRFQFQDYPSEFLGGQGRILGIANFLVSSTEIYARLFVLPWPLRVDHAFEPATSLSSHRIILSAILTLILISGALFLATRNTSALFGLALAALGILPVSQIVPVPDPVAERFLYMPLAGIALILAGWIAASANAWWPHRRIVITLLCIWIIGLAAVSHRRSLDWRDDITLNIANWEQAGDRRPVALRSLGALHLSRAQQALSANDTQRAAHAFAQSRTALEELVAAQPNDAEGHRLLSVWHLSQGNRDLAIEHYRRSVAAQPDNQLLLPLAAALGMPPPSPHDGDLLSP